MALLDVIHRLSIWQTLNSPFWLPPAICLYFYELPSHHCPFCILQKEYGYVGYALYATLLGGATSGLGAGALAPFSGFESLSKVIPQIQRQLTAVTLILYLLFTLIVVVRMLTTSFRLSG